LRPEKRAAAPKDGRTRFVGRRIAFEDANAREPRAVTSGSSAVARGLSPPGHEERMASRSAAKR